MITRLAVSTDFKAISELLKTNFVAPPDNFDEIQDLFFVVEKKGCIIGTIWALVGQSTVAYVGYLSAANIPGRSQVICILFKKIIVELKKRKITKIMFFTDKWNHKVVNLIHKHFKRSNITKMPDPYLFQKVL